MNIESDKNTYNCGGLARCCEEGARHKQLDRMNIFLQDPATEFHEAATRLYTKIEFEAHDLFSADIYYQNSCYIRFALKKIQQTVDENVELLESDIFEFFLALNKRIVHRRDAFLLSNLLEDIKTLSELNGLMEPIISNARTIKRRGAINKFSNDICFYPKVNYLIVHSSNFNPCEYVRAISRGKRLKDYDIIISFGELIRRKLR